MLSAINKLRLYFSVTSRILTADCNNYIPVIKAHICFLLISCHARTKRVLDLFASACDWFLDFKHVINENSSFLELIPNVRITGLSDVLWDPPKAYDKIQWFSCSTWSEWNALRNSLRKLCFNLHRKISAIVKTHSRIVKFVESFSFIALITRKFFSV